MLPGCLPLVGRAGGEVTGSSGGGPAGVGTGGSLVRHPLRALTPRVLGRAQSGPPRPCTVQQDTAPGPPWLGFPFVKMGVTWGCPSLGTTLPKRVLQERVCRAGERTRASNAGEPQHDLWLGPRSWGSTPWGCPGSAQSWSNTGLSRCRGVFRRGEHFSPPRRVLRLPQGPALLPTGLRPAAASPGAPSLVAVLPASVT